MQYSLDIEVHENYTSCDSTYCVETIIIHIIILIFPLNG
jgi:hypothetical protein